MSLRRPIWASQRFPGGSGLWRGGLWTSQRSAITTEKIRDLLFGAAQQGVLYYPKPIVDGQQVLFQDAAGTTPVTADSQPVRLMLDLSGNGNHATAPSDAARPLYRTDGVSHWLRGDGIDDAMQTSFEQQWSPGIMIGLSASMGIGGDTSMHSLFGITDGESNNETNGVVLRLRTDTFAGSSRVGMRWRNISGGGDTGFNDVDVGREKTSFASVGSVWDDASVSIETDEGFSANSPADTDFLTISVPIRICTHILPWDFFGGTVVDDFNETHKTQILNYMAALKP